jgi:hypothetical protein
MARDGEAYTEAADSAAAASNVAGGIKRKAEEPWSALEPLEYISAPMCGCGAGVCIIERDALGAFFVCPEEVGRPPTVQHSSHPHMLRRGCTVPE